MKKYIQILLIVGLILQKGFAQAPLTQAEYYWDTDPGLGLGTSLGSFNTTVLNINPSIPTTGLPVGYHTLYVRVKDGNNLWSQVVSQKILIGAENNFGSNPQDVRVLEYQWDALTPVLVNITGITDYSFIQNIPTTSLAEGSHSLSIRVKDGFGLWSPKSLQTVLVYGTAPNISRIEYFVGVGQSDPGLGLATNVPFTPAVGSDVLADFEVPTTGLPVGDNLITFRVKDSNNHWSYLLYQRVFSLNTNLVETITTANWNTNNTWNINNVPNGTQNPRIRATHTVTVPNGGNQVNTIQMMGGSINLNGGTIQINN